MNFTGLSFASLGFIFCLFIIPSVVSSGSSSQARWAVTDPATGNRCVLATFGASFLIEYKFTNSANQTDLRNASLSIPTTGVRVDNASFCNGGTLGTYNQLKLKWINFGYPYALTLVFKTLVNNSTSVSQVFLEYSLDDSSVFPHASEGGNRIAQYVGPSPVEVIPPKSYLKCDRGFPVSGMTESIDETAVSGMMYDVKLQAFRVSTTDTFDDDVSVCPEDMTTTREPATTTETTPHPETTTTSYPGITTTPVVVPPVINVVVNVNISVIGNANGNGNVNGTLKNGLGVFLAFFISILWLASATK